MRRKKKGSHIFFLLQLNQSLSAIVKYIHIINNLKLNYVPNFLTCLNHDNDIIRYDFFPTFLEESLQNWQSVVSKTKLSLITVSYRFCIFLSFVPIFSFSISA